MQGPEGTRAGEGEGLVVTGDGLGVEGCGVWDEAAFEDASDDSGDSRERERERSGEKERPRSKEAQGRGGKDIAGREGI